MGPCCCGRRASEKASGSPSPSPAHVILHLKCIYFILLHPIPFIFYVFIFTSLSLLLPCSFLFYFAQLCLIEFPSLSTLRADGQSLSPRSLHLPLFLLGGKDVPRVLELVPARSPSFGRGAVGGPPRRPGRAAVPMPGWSSPCVTRLSHRPAAACSRALTDLLLPGPRWGRRPPLLHPRPSLKIQ